MVGKIKKISELPGKGSRKLLEMKERYVTHTIGAICPAFIDSASGSYLRDVDGNVFIDMATGIGVNILGNRHERVIFELEKQLKRYLHLCFGVVLFEEYVQLAKRLAEITPGRFDKRTFLNNSGAEAVENAVKFARYYSKRPKMVSFINSFHGRTMYALALTGKDAPYKNGYEPFPAEVLHTPFAYCYRCHLKLDPERCSMECLEELRKLLRKRENRGKIASIIYESMQGEGGYIVPPKEFLIGVAEIASENSVTLIDDEIQTGFGRTGRMFATEHFGVVPDLLVSGKGIGGGLPLSSITGRKEIMNSPPKGGMGSTFGGNPLSCVAALEVIEIVSENLDRVPPLSRYVRRRLEEMHSDHRIIGDVRGMGLLMGLEFVKDRKSKQPAKEETNMILSICAKNGLIALGGGLYGNVLRLHPSMLIERKILEKALDILDNSIGEFERKNKS